MAPEGGSEKRLVKRLVIDERLLVKLLMYVKKNKDANILQLYGTTASADSLVDVWLSNILFEIYFVASFRGIPLIPMQFQKRFQIRYKSQILQISCSHCQASGCFTKGPLCKKITFQISD